MKTICFLIYLVTTVTANEEDNIPSVFKENPIAVHARLGEACSIDIECYVKNSACVVNVCVCETKFVADPDNMQCYEIQDQLLGNCLISRQCSAGKLGNFSECVDNGLGTRLCQCRQDAVFDSNNYICLPKTYLGENCQIDFQCSTPNTFCSEDYTCRCATGFTAEENYTGCFEIRHELNSTCEISSQCTKGRLGLESECRMSENGNSTCQCKQNAEYDPISGRCR